MSNLDTRSALLAEAEHLIRTMGYAAFSYADLSERVGIRKASIHHHFPTKERLGMAVVDTYLERFTVELDALIVRSTDTKRRLIAFGDFFSASLKVGQLPLCNALAAEAAYLPASMQSRVKTFFELHLFWLETVLRQGVVANDITIREPPKKTALQLLSTLQGASIVAWALKDASVIKPAYRRTMEALIT